MKHVALLPNLFTLANAGCGLLAISKAIDALALGPTDPGFHGTFETACWLIMFALILDALDGKVARLTDSFSDFGAQLDSFADAITFGVAPAMVGKVLLESQGLYHPRLNFFAAAAFTLMAILRLARFNVGNEHSEEAHRRFIGLPSPAAAGTLVITILMSFSLGGGIEGTGSQATAVGKGLSFVPEAWRSAIAAALLPSVLFLMLGLGLLMVSRVSYVHGFGGVLGSGGFPTLVKMVFFFLGLYLAPVPVLFVVGYGYVIHGMLASLRSRGAEPIQQRSAA